MRVTWGTLTQRESFSVQSSETHRRSGTSVAKPCHENTHGLRQIPSLSQPVESFENTLQNPLPGDIGDYPTIFNGRIQYDPVLV